MRARLPAVAGRRLDLVRQLDLFRQLHPRWRKPHEAAQEGRPHRLGLYPEWSYSWPVNRRVIYNRASVDPQGKPWNPKKALVQWKDGQWIGDVPDGPAPPLAMQGGKLPFIMQPEGLGALYGPGLAEGPIPEHYEPWKSPFKKNIMSASGSTRPSIASART